MVQATEQPIRLFISIDPSEEAKEALTEAIQEMDQEVPDLVRWVRQHRFHLTVKFFGDVDPSYVDGILAAMDQTSQSLPDGKFKLSLSNLGMFPDKRAPRVIWAGVQGGSDSLNNLHSTLDQALHKIGFLLDRDQYRPHITLGRPKKGVPRSELGAIGKVIDNWQPLPPVEWEVDAIHLIHSILDWSRSQYIRLGSATL